VSISISLTVAQSKRLIAKGMVASSVFRDTCENGRVLIIKGTTNAYIVEEMIGETIDKLAFARGLTLPHGVRRRKPEGRVLGDVLIDHGHIHVDVDMTEVVDDLGRGDLILKGANAIDYQRGLAGVLIGDPRSGTIGMALRKAVGSHVRLMIPVGLEKQIGGDVVAVARMLQSPQHRGEGMMLLWADLFTEIEACSILWGLRATHIASGGVSGAEGAVRLALEGDDQALRRARETLEQIYSEPSLT